MSNEPRNSSEEIAILWTKAQPTVSAFISSMLPDFHQAEDVLQQVAVIVVRKFEQYDPAQPFISWALGIAKNEVLKSRRAFVADRHVFDEELCEQLTDGYQESVKEFEDVRSALAHCMRGLRGRAKNIMELRYGLDLKPAAIAKKVDMQPGAVRVLLHRVRGALRDCINKRLGKAGGEL